MNHGLLRSCLVVCIFTIGMQFRSQEEYTQTHQKHCYLSGVREVDMMKICAVCMVVMLISVWLTVQMMESQTEHEGGLPNGMQSGGSQMTTAPRE